MPVENDKVKDLISSAEMKETFATIVLAGGVLCVITGIMGLLTAMKKNAFFAAPFIGLAFIIGLLLLIGAVMAGGDEKFLEEMKGKICDKLEETAGMKFEESYGAVVDGIMCTPICPCDKADGALWKEIK